MIRVKLDGITYECETALEAIALTRAYVVADVTAQEPAEYQQPVAPPINGTRYGVPM